MPIDRRPLFIDISIHAPREGGDDAQFKDTWRELISIHAPREGGDIGLRCRSGINSSFQSTPPARGATICAAGLHAHHVISIHVPREGGDSVRQQRENSHIISIHAPREGGDIGI